MKFNIAKVILIVMGTALYTSSIWALKFIDVACINIFAFMICISMSIGLLCGVFHLCLENWDK